MGEHLNLGSYSYSYRSAFQSDVTSVFRAFDARSDGAFVLPDLEILDIQCHRANEDGIRALFGMIRARFSATNVSSIKGLSLRNVALNQLYQYEIERLVPSLVITRY